MNKLCKQFLTKKSVTSPISTVGNRAKKAHKAKNESEQAEIRTTIMILVSSIVLILGRLPYFIQLVMFIQNTGVSALFTNTISFITSFLSFSVQFFIYYFFDKNFKKIFSEFFKKK